MASIPPTEGPSQPTPPQEPTNVLATRLANATSEFTKQTNRILNSPHLADDRGTLENYAKSVVSLHQLSQKAGG